MCFRGGQQSATGSGLPGEAKDLNLWKPPDPHRSVRSIGHGLQAIPRVGSQATHPEEGSAGQTKPGRDPRRAVGRTDSQNPRPGQGVRRPPTKREKYLAEALHFRSRKLPAARAAEILWTTDWHLRRPHVRHRLAEMRTAGRLPILRVEVTKRSGSDLHSMPHTTRNQLPLCPGS